MKKENEYGNEKKKVKNRKRHHYRHRKIAPPQAAKQL